MGALRSLVLLATGAVVGVSALIAYRIAQETGKPIEEALADVPAELERLLRDVKAWGEDALEKRWDLPAGPETKLAD